MLNSLILGVILLIETILLRLNRYLASDDAFGDKSLNPIFGLDSLTLSDCLSVRYTSMLVLVVSVVHYIAMKQYQSKSIMDLTSVYSVA